MSTTTRTFAKIIRVRGVLVIALIAILIITTVAIITGLILGGFQEIFQADRILVI